MIRLRYKIGIGIGLLLIAFLYGRCGKVKPETPSKLPKGDTEQIRVDPSRHTITIITPSGTKTETLPDRLSTFNVHANGTVTVISRQFGFERHLFMGATVSDKPRIAIGMDGWYFKKLDLGFGVAGQVGQYAPILFVKATYAIKGNVQAGIIYGSNQYIGGVLSVRLF